MPVFRILGICCLALVLIFALALPSVDQSWVNQVMSQSMRRVGCGLDRMAAPAVTIARRADETLFDPPSQLPR